MKIRKALLAWLEMFLTWLPATAVGWSVGLVLAIIPYEVARQFLPDVLSLVVVGTLAGLVLGFVQWVGLRPGLKRLSLWLLATALGWLAGLLVVTLLDVTLDGVWSGLLGGLLGGLVMGAAQWLALHPQRARRKAWLSVTILGWTAFYALGLASEHALPLAFVDRFLHNTLSGAAGLAMLGAASAILLIVGFCQPHKKDLSDRVKWWM